MLKHSLKYHRSESPDSDQGYFLSSDQRQFFISKLQINLRPEYRRRIEIMLLADLGQSQTQICEALQCSHETARYWISMLQTGQAHLWNIFPIGRPKTITDQYLARLKELVSHSPRDYGYCFRTWTADWLSKHLAREFDIKVSDRHINRLLKKMGLSTRPKSTETKEPDPPPEGTTIVVRNLHSSSPSEPLPLWPFKPLQSE